MCVAYPLVILATHGRRRHDLEIHRQSANNPQESRILSDDDLASVGTILRSAALRRPVKLGISRLAVSSQVDSSSEVGRVSGVSANEGSYEACSATEPRCNGDGSPLLPHDSVVHPRSAPTGSTTWRPLSGQSTPTHRWLRSPEVSALKSIGTTKRTLWSWIFSRALPAASLLILVVLQIWTLASDGRVLVVHPTLAVAVGCLRSGLYAVFLSIPAVVLLLHDPPVASDERIVIRALAIVTTFFLIILSLLAPSGPVLFRVSLTGEEAALAMTLVGVALGVYAMATLGMNFSLWPEARRLVVSGPYRLVRHPIYLAEIIMSAGALILNLRLTMVVGEFIVIVLVRARIHVEERLLGSTFPAFKEFETATHHRLIPGVW